MNRHQVLTGAVNAGDRCFAVGSVEGVHFTAYGAGCNVVILANDFQRVQIIPGSSHDCHLEVTCVSCCSDFGKIAASFGSKICIFEPTPLLHRNSSHKLDYQWYQTGTIQLENDVLALNWNLDGTRLLTSTTDALQMWQNLELMIPRSAAADPKEVEFFIEEEEDEGGREGGGGGGGEDEDESYKFHVVPTTEWKSVWRCSLPNPATTIQFSSDGVLFATFGENDRMVKIWYENRKFQLLLTTTQPETSRGSGDALSFGFFYLAHPRAVTGLNWRRTSKYLPKGSTANMLITSCKDNICRIWCETILPEDGLLDTQQLEPRGEAAAASNALQMQRNKKRFTQRIQQIRHVLHKRSTKKTSTANVSSIDNNPSIVGPLGIPDAPTKYDEPFSCVSATNQFHLAASINLSADVPLIGSLDGSNSSTHNFFICWLDNKEFHATLEAEKVIEEMSQKAAAVAEPAAAPVVMRNLVTPARRQTRHSRWSMGLPTIGSDPSMNDSRKTLSVNLQKTKSSVNMERSRSPMSVSSVFSPDDAIDSNEYKTDIGAENLESRIECLIQNWNQESDVLFAIHPTDGSLLMWVVDYLDETSPGSFHQAKVSFSSMLPRAFPVFDALTVRPNLWLYCEYGRHGLRSLKTESEESRQPSSSETGIPGPKTTTSSRSNAATGPNSSGRSDDSSIPNVILVTSHVDGSLNNWQMTFAETSNFSSVINVLHISRTSGHRFHTDGSACHPVLPLLLTTSHHRDDDERSSGAAEDDAEFEHEKSCSELILWKVASVGPLSKSGGIQELARINSSSPTSFSNVAWLPTLLPTSSLGSFSASPSALFVASDGVGFRIYQAVLDARSILAEQETNSRSKPNRLSSETSSPVEEIPTPRKRSTFDDLWKVVSLQSTSRPGCIIDVAPVNDSDQTKQHIQLIHVFEERLISGSMTTVTSSEDGGSRSDAKISSAFRGRFYLVVMETAKDGSTSLKMWQINVFSKGGQEIVEYSHDVNFLRESDVSSGTASKQHPVGSSGLTHLSGNDQRKEENANKLLNITTKKVCCERLALPDGVSVTKAAVAAGHLSSSSIYPACFSPYLISTACTDGRARFWHCEVSGSGDESRSYRWKEWESVKGEQGTSRISLKGKVLSVSCAYSGRVAIAYRTKNEEETREKDATLNVSLHVAIYECESTGGCEWKLEDTIRLKDLVIRDPKLEIDLSLIYDNEQQQQQRQRDSNVSDQSSTLVASSPPSVVRSSTSVPSSTTVQSIRRYLSDRSLSSSRTTTTTRPRVKRLVHLDWVSTEDGSFVLTVGMATKILLYAAVSGASRPDGGDRPQQVATLRRNDGVAAVGLRWRKLRSIELCTADGLAPLPMHISWVRLGILVVGMDNEMQVYSQWRGPERGDEDHVGSERLAAAAIPAPHSGLRQRNTSTALARTMSGIKMNASIMNLSLLAERREIERRGRAQAAPESPTPTRQLLKPEPDVGVAGALDECGLFEAARLAGPRLPQYHTNQLLELLSLGKTRCVKAILSHLLRCIAGASRSTKRGGSGGGGRGVELKNGPAADEDGETTTSKSSPETGFSLSPAPDEPSEFLEISSIPPLPLFALLSADDDSFRPSTTAADAGAASPGNTDYDALLNLETAPDEGLGNLLDDESDSKARTTDDDSLAAIGPNEFGPAQAHLLARHLTRTQLPGMSSLDQMYLMALSETLANMKLGLVDAKMAVKSDAAVANEARGEATVPEAIDDCGLRFLLPARHHLYLVNTLPLRQRVLLQMQGLSSPTFAWAFHSESEQELLNCLPSMQKGEPTWEELRQFGAGWWLRNINTLTRCMEQVAKTAFQANKDPLDAAIFYLAMKKKTVLWGLFRSLDDHRMAEFFKNNFSEDRWRKAALKNAFALLGKQLFQRAVAFFLLGGAVRDAIEICLTRLEDIQLAFVILRLYEGDLEDSLSVRCKTLLFREILGCDENGDGRDPARASQDPFLRSMAYWILKDYRAALDTLLLPEETTEPTSAADRPSWMERNCSKSNVFNFYNHLRSHPRIVRQNLGKASADVVVGPSRGSSSGTERRLYFETAHEHFKSGCPLLALEVLTKMPPVFEADGGEEEEGGTTKTSGDAASSFVAVSTTADDFDWSRPVTRFDEEEELDLSFGNSDDERGGEEEKPDYSSDENKGNQGASSKIDSTKGTSVRDVMAQQLKFIACIKILVDELATLATGFEVDGGQLRYQLYVWLEKEVEVLRRICDYGEDEDPGFAEKAPDVAEISGVPVSDAAAAASDSMLHETILAEKSDFEAKLNRMARRKEWLKANHHLLGTLLSYSILHGSSDGGLASMRMELLLLMQELQQETMQQQQHLLSPLPFPTTLPLVSASVASVRTVVADPIQHLQSMCNDLLHTLIEMRTTPAADVFPDKMFLLRDLSVALSACVYQCLCDSDSFMVTSADNVDIGMECFTNTNVIYKDSHLMAGAQKGKLLGGDVSLPEVPTSKPASWPGVTSLVALMNQRRDDDAPKLNVLLTEALVSVYVSLLSYGLATYDAIVLYRLVAHPLVDGVWPLLFGGGCKKQMRVSTANELKTSTPKDDHNQSIRNRFHRHVLGATVSTKEDRPMFQEKFIPPQTNMISYFLAKVKNVDQSGVDYDSTNSICSDQEEEDDEATYEDDVISDVVSPQRKEAGLREHLDPSSYSWCLMQYAIVKYACRSLKEFLPTIGIDLSDLPVLSPLVHSVVKNVESWEVQLRERMDEFAGPPNDYIPGSSLNSSFGVVIVKYSTLTDPTKTPFQSTHYSALPAKRLWHFLVKTSELRDTFSQYIFGKGHNQTTQEKLHSINSVDADSTKVVYKDQEAISSFCFSQGNVNNLILATQKELLEMDISKILVPQSQSQSDLDGDVEIIQNSSLVSERTEGGLPLNEFLSKSATLLSSDSNSSSMNGGNMTGFGAAVLLWRSLPGVKRLAAHPKLPYYLTGSHNGCLRLWEWGRMECVNDLHRPGVFAKPTKLLFNSQGNKFGMSDIDGNVSLWQLGHGANTTTPYLSMKCHSKSANDFVFVGSSSLFATAGLSTDGSNVCLWDTLLPRQKSLVKAFQCHNDGCPALIYAPYHQVIISGGKKGELCIFDVRQRQLRQTFLAHSSAVRSISLEPTEDCFVTGSADGEMKVWGLTVHTLLHTFSGERPKGSSLFRNAAPAVSQVYLGPHGRLFSSALDGSLRVRQIDRSNSPIVGSWFNNLATAVAIGVAPALAPAPVPAATGVASADYTRF